MERATVVLRIDGQDERVSGDRMVEAHSLLANMRKDAVSKTLTGINEASAVITRHPLPEKSHTEPPKREAPTGSKTEEKAPTDRLRKIPRTEVRREQRPRDNEGESTPLAA